MGKILNSGYGAIFGTYWIIYAVVSSFASVFMLAKGYTNSQIGMTLAAANVLAVIMQPLIADFVDRSKRFDVMGTTGFSSESMRSASSVSTMSNGSFSTSSAMMSFELVSSQYAFASQ